MAGEVEFAPTQADWVAANALWMRHSSYSRWKRWFALALLALAAADIGLRLWVGDSLARGVTDSSLLLLFASALLGLPFFSRLFLPRSVRRMFQQRPSMAEPVTVRWDAKRLPSTTSPVPIFNPGQRCTAGCRISIRSFCFRPIAC